MAKRTKANISKYLQATLPPDVMDFFRQHGSKGGKIGGKRSLETMTAAQRKARAQKAGKASGLARSARKRTP